MNDSLLYMPRYYFNEEVIPAGNPFFLAAGGVKISFSPDYHHTENLNRMRNCSYYNGNITKVNTRFELFAWKDGWERVSSSISVLYSKIKRSDQWTPLLNEKENVADMKVQNFVSFEGFPSNGLNRLGDNTQPFWMLNGQIIRNGPWRKFIFRKLRVA